MDQSLNGSENIKMENESPELTIMDQSLNKSLNIKMENESPELTIMDLSQNGSANMKMENEPSEVALDLRKFNVKRRREFEDRFNDEVKKIKSDETVFPVQEETLRYKLGTLMVQTLHCIDTFQRIMQTINMKREPVSTELPHSMCIDNGIKAEPINLTKTLTTGKSLCMIPSSLSMQSGPVRTQVCEGIIIKQEPTDQENISPNVSNMNHQNVNVANEDSPDVVIGPNGTRVSKKDLANIYYMEVSIATRKLLTLVFDRQTLATHTLSGRPSNRFPNSNRPLKPQLDHLKVADIIYYVKRVFNCTEADIRHAIAVKCAEIDRIVNKRSLSKANLD